MSKVKKIEQEIEELSRTEFSELRDWILERDWEAWDAQIERDTKAGRLDCLVREAEKDYQAGRTKKL